MPAILSTFRIRGARAALHALSVAALVGQIGCSDDDAATGSAAAGAPGGGVTSGEPGATSGNGAGGSASAGPGGGGPGASSASSGGGGEVESCDSRSAPDWFVDMEPGTWTTIAGSAGETISDVLPNPVPYTGLSGESPTCITKAWTGGSVDQARKEYMLAANGGHADYPGNEAYGISLLDAAPAWRRLADPTPNDQMGDVFDEGNGLYADGRPRAMHSSFQCFGDGRIWFPFQNSVTSGGGGGMDGVVAFHRALLGEATTPLPWTSGNLGAWELYGKVWPDDISMVGMIFGVCAFDRVDHKVWALGGNSANYTFYWSVGTGDANLGQKNHYAAGKSFGHWGSWVVVAHDLRILVAADHLLGKITVLDLEKAGQDGDWQEVSNVSGPGFHAAGAGAGYVMANHAIAAGDPRTGNAIHKLLIPTKVEGGATVYDPAGTWEWTTLNPSGPAMTVPEGNSSPFTKWNLVEDMCNGESAVVVVTDIHGPVYVYKVPASGL